MLKIYKILFLSVGLFFITNEVWMAQLPAGHLERKMALSPRGQSLSSQDSSDSKQLNEDEKLADSLLLMDLSSEQISIEDFIACVGKMGPLISNGEILNEVGSLITELHASKHEPEEKIIGIAKELVKKLDEGINYKNIIYFIIRKRDLLFAQAFFKLGFRFDSDEVNYFFDMAKECDETFGVNAQLHEVLRYLQANYDLLCEARYGNSKKCLEALQAGAYVNVIDSENTSLHRAVSIFNEGLIDILIAVGADVNAQDSYAQTPLHEVILSRKINWGKSIVKHKSIVRKLLDAKAKTDMRDNDGLTALDHAKKCRLADVFAKFEIH